LTRAKNQGDTKAIKKAQQKLAIVHRNIEAIKDQDEKIDQMTYGEEDTTQRRPYITVNY